MPEFIDGFDNKEQTITKNQDDKEANQMTKTLDIEGMMCANCQAHVQKALEGVAGVQQVVVSLEENKATVTADAGVEDKALIDAVTESGYKVVSCKEQ